MFGALTRMRGTLNAKALLVSKMHWLIKVKAGTLHAHTRRLMPYEASIAGKFNIDLDIAYKQLQSRLAALLLLHNAAKSYSEPKKMNELVPVIAPMQVLGEYLRRCDASFAPNLFALQAHSGYQQTFLDTSSASAALKTLSFKDLLDGRIKITAVPIPAPAPVHDGDDGDEQYRRPLCFTSKKKCRAHCRASTLFGLPIPMHELRRPLKKLTRRVDFCLKPHSPHVGGSRPNSDLGMDTCMCRCCSFCSDTSGRAGSISGVRHETPPPYTHDSGSLVVLGGGNAWA